MRGKSSFEPFISRLSDFIRSSVNPGAKAGHNSFDSLALELFALQFAHNPVYRNFCESRGVTPNRVEHWTRIPSIPTTAFKEHDFSCLTDEERTSVFHSSGTTGHRPSRHFHNPESLAIYEDSLLTWFFVKALDRGCVRSTSRSAFSEQRASNSMDLPDVIEASAPGLQDTTAVHSGNLLRLIVLTPPATQTPHSSLVHMFDTIRRSMRQPETVFLGEIGPDGAWELNREAVVASLKESGQSKLPYFILGTAFSFVHLLDHLAAQNLCFELPPGSRVLETGGYKGRARSMAKGELHSLIRNLLGLQPKHIIGEYGMSELSSQAYDSPSPDFPNGPFHFPPWAQVQIISPETSHEVGEGESGLVRVFDLANTFSVMAIQTEDLAIRRGTGFELLGRAALAETRGCSLMAI